MLTDGDDGFLEVGDAKDHFVAASRTYIGTLRITRVLGCTDGVLFGSDPYSLDSRVGTAAVHAGLVQPGQSGLVKVEIGPSGEPFEGSARHGVTSDAYDADPRGHSGSSVIRRC